MSKPTIRRGPAARHAGPNETIVEVWSQGTRMGLLLCIRESVVDGKPALLVEPYNADDGVLLRMHGTDTPIKQHTGVIKP